MKRIIAASIAVLVFSSANLAALAPAQAAAPLACPKTEPAHPMKVNSDLGYPAPHVPAAAIFCSYDNVVNPKALLGWAKVKNPMALALAINASRKLPVVQNYACTADMGTTSAIIFRDTSGHLSRVVRDDFGCRILYSSLTANKYWLGTAAETTWDKYRRYIAQK